MSALLMDQVSLYASGIEPGFPADYLSAYCVSKGAVTQLTEFPAVELRAMIASQTAGAIVKMASVTALGEYYLSATTPRRRTMWSA
jgi:hypothetical protein